MRAKQHQKHSSHGSTSVRKSIGGGCPRTQNDNSEFLQSESLTEVLCLFPVEKPPTEDVRNSLLSTDAYKLKVEKSGKGVLGRSGGGL